MAFRHFYRYRHYCFNDNV